MSHSRGIESRIITHKQQSVDCFTGYVCFTVEDAKLAKVYQSKQYQNNASLFDVPTHLVLHGRGSSFACRTGKNSMAINFNQVV